MKIPESVKLFFAKMMYREDKLEQYLVVLLMGFFLCVSILLIFLSLFLLFPVLHIHNDMLPDFLYKINVRWFHIPLTFISGIIFGVFAIMQFTSIIREWHKELPEYIKENKKTVIQRAKKVLKELNDDNLTEELNLLIGGLSSGKDELMYAKVEKLEKWLNKYGEWKYSLYKIEKQKEVSKKILHELA